MAFLLLVAIVPAMTLGFAAHRGSVCTVRAVAEVMTSRSAYMLASIGKSVLWVWALTLPLYWLMPETVTSLAGWQFTGTAAFAGFLFGFGAAINGGCAYATMARLVDGDGRMAAMIAGFALGVFGFTFSVQRQWLAGPTPAPAQIASLLSWALLGAAAILLFGLYEAARLWRTRQTDMSLRELILAKRYRLSSAAMMIGLSGGQLFLLFGPFGYTATFALVIEGALGTRGWPAAARVILMLAVIAGMVLSTVLSRSFKLNWRPRAAWLYNIVGGVLMGFGASLAPGGNDALVLYGVPILSPYALPTLTALTAGVLIGLLVMRHLFGHETRAICRNDLFVADTWTKPPEPATPRA
jgi:uncharacterized membrane protein YedE/YeeE